MQMYEEKTETPSDSEKNISIVVTFQFSGHGCHFAFLHDSPSLLSCNNL